MYRYTLTVTNDDDVVISVDAPTMEQLEEQFRLVGNKVARYEELQEEKADNF